MISAALGADYEEAPAWEDLLWQLSAACQGLPDYVYFPELTNEHAVRYAKKICAICPVLQECRDWALTHHERHGVWGGLSEKDRRAIWRRQRETVPKY